MSRPLNKVGFLFVAALIALVQTTCSEPESILCKFEEQEYVCPKETRCAVTQALCITEKCGDGVLDSSDGEECDDGNLIHGDGCSKDCKREYCGNGIVEINEVCDHNLGENSPVGTEDCSVDCRFNLKCGDKILDPNEDCEYIREDGTKAPDCSSNCKFIKCGNGVIDNEEHVAVALKETCDPGNEEENISAVFPENTSLSAKCLANCTIQLCGDGTVNGDEECDPGRDGLTAGCTDICTISQCGDGILNGKAGEECDCKQAEGECPDDWREWRGSPTCTNLCQDNECGDLYLGADEECDDGRLGSLRCTKTCKFNRQGDGYIGARLNEDGSYIYEQDEDGNIKTDEEGNPIVVQEECDDGVEGSQLCTPDGYRSECGDGRINPLDNRSTGWAQEDCDREGKCGEQCDPGPDRTLAGGRDIVDSTILCNRDCRISVCGDKFVNEDVDYSDSEKHEDAEECDLNTLNLQMGYDPETSPDLFFSHALTALCKKNPQPPAWDAEYYSRICNGSAVKEDDEEDSAGRRVRAVKEKYYVEYVRTYLGNTQHKAVNAIGICNGYAGGVEGFESNKCRPIRCGNGIIEYGEVCELSTTPGRFINERGEESEAIRYCSSDCRSTGICGNGIVDYAEGEICDSDDLNECSSDCKTGDLCGNGTIDQSEACDTGYDPDHPPTNKGYCVIESARNDMDWKIITYTELPSENTEDDCVRASGEWVKETSSCRLLDNCIVNNRVERCYIKTEAIECSGLGCYSGQDESLTKEDLCKANPDRDWLHICIPKSCTLASCGDGYVFNELDPSDPQGTILSGRMEECDYADAKPEEIAQGVPVNPVTGSPVSPEYQGEVKYCNYNCKFNTCGDAIISASDGEECDWGNDGSSKYHNGLTECPNGEHSCKLCTTECKLEEIGCGNGVLEGEEQCDYGKQGVSDVDHEDKCMKYPCKVCANSCDSPEATYYALVVNPPQNGTIYSTIGINCSFEGASTCSLKTTVEGPHAFTATANPGYELDTARGTAGWELQTGHSCVPSGTSLNCDSLLQNSNQALTIGVYFKSRTPVIEVSSRVGNLEMSLPLPGVTLTCKILGEETFSSCEEYQASQYYGQTLIIQKEENENVMTHYKFASWSGCTPLPDSTCSVEISRENVAPIIVYADYSANKYQVNSSIKYNSFAESAIVLCNGMPCSAALFNKDEDVAVSLDLVNSICEGATFVAMRDDVSKSANDVLYHCSCSGNKLTSCKECPDENPGTYNPSVCETPVEAIDLPSFLIAGPRTVGIEFKGIADQNITITDPGTQGTVTVKKTGAPPSNEPYLLASCGVAGAGVCQGFVSPGTPVQLSAVAATNYQLAGWFITEGPAQPVFVSNSAHTLTVTDATTIEAVFAPKLTISVKDGIEGARIGCSFPMDEEDKQYFENGAYLVKECPGSWSDNVCTISPTIDFSDCSGPYATGVVVTLTANTLAEYSNPEWVVEDGIESNPVVVEIDSPKNVMVQYDEVKSAGVRYIGRNLIEESLLECWRYGFTIDSSDYLYIEKLASCESFAAAGLANYRDKFLIKVKAGSERQVRWEAKSGRFDAYYRGSGGNQRRYQGHGYRCVSELASIFSGISTNPSSPTRKDRSSNVNRFLTTDGGGIDRYGDWSPLVDGGSVECSPGNVLYINLNSETYGEITYSHIPARLAFGTPPEGVSWNSNMTVNGMTLPREDGPISAGAKVLVSVNPDDNTITGWTGITCDHLSQDKTSCLFTMPSSPVTINVTVKQKYLLTVTSPPPEGVTWNTNMTINGVTKPLQNDQIEGGAQVILGVTPGNNTIEWILTGGATCDVSLLNLSNNTLCLFEMPSANTNARVNATPNNYTLTTSALPEVGTSVQCSTDADDPCNAARGGCAPTYSKNTKVCVHFDPPSSYEFAGVAYLTCPGTRTVSETVQRCELTMDSNKTVSIIFTQKPNITAMKLPVDPTNDGILASSLGSLPAAEYLPSTTLVGFTASNGDDYEFLTSNNSYTCATQAWTGSSSPYSCDVTVNGPTSYYVYAIFTRKPVLTIAMVGEHAELGYSAESCPAPIEELDAGDMQSPGAPMPVDSGSSHCVQVTIDPGWSLEATGCLGGVWQEISANIYQCRVDSISSNTTVTATISREPAVENTLNIGSITNGVLSACPASVEADDNAVTSGPHNYLTDTTVSICATASNTGAAPIGGAGCPGTGWNAEGDDVYSCVVTMDVDQIVFAIFASELAPDAGEEEPDAGGEDPGEDAGEEEPDAGGEDPGEDAGEEEPDAGGEDPGEDAGEEEPDAGGEDPGEDAGEEELDAGEEDPGEEDPEIE